MKLSVYYACFGAVFLIPMFIVLAILASLSLKLEFKKEWILSLLIGTYMFQ